MRSDWDDDDTGYGKPPRWTRFRKGESGNPRGRPKKSRAEAKPPVPSEADAVLRAELDRKVRVTENGKARDCPSSEHLAQIGA